MYYYEQPSVEFEDQLLIFLTENNIEKFFSTILPLNEIYPKRLDKVPMIKYEYLDTNNDGLKDIFRYKINIPVENVALIQNVRIAILYNYEFRANIVGKMNTVAMIDISLPFGASFIKIDGDLELRQSIPIDVTTFFNELYYENIFKVTKKEDYQTYSFMEIYQEYYERDFYTKYEYDTFIETRRNPKVLQLDISVNIPSYQKILYKTPIFTKFKFFWVQYIAVLIPVAVVLYLVAKFAFHNLVIPTVTTTDLEIKKKKQL